jgi:hypothetical protein
VETDGSMTSLENGRDLEPGELEEQKMCHADVTCHVTCVE